MSRYFFHMHIGDGYVSDDDGIDLPDLESVRREAVAAAREMVAAAVLLGRLPLHECFEITDEQGNLLLSLPFSSVVEIQGIESHCSHVRPMPELMTTTIRTH